MCPGVFLAELFAFFLTTPGHRIRLSFLYLDTYCIVFLPQNALDAVGPDRTRTKPDGCTLRRQMGDRFLNVSLPN